MTHPVPTVPSQEPLPFAYARGAWAVLATLALFQLVALVEAGAYFGVSATMAGGGAWKLGTAQVVVIMLALVARAILLVRVLRLPPVAKMGPLPTWQPVALTIVSITGALGSLGLRTLTSAYAARNGIEELATVATVSSIVSAGGYVADQVLMIAALWLAFARGRDVLPPVGPA